MPNDWQVSEDPELDKVYIHRNDYHRANQPISITIQHVDKNSLNESAAERLDFIFDEMDGSISFSEPPNELFSTHWQDLVATRVQQVNSIVLPDQSTWWPIDDFVVISYDDGFLIVNVSRSGFENYYLDNEATNIVNSIR